MVVIYGSRLMGKVDEVPGLFHVATKFGHINYVPLVPIQSYIVVSHNGNTFRGVPIALSGKSILVGYGRALAIVLAIIGVIWSVIVLSDTRGSIADDVKLPAISTAVLGIGL